MRGQRNSGRRRPGAATIPPGRSGHGRFEEFRCPHPTNRQSSVCQLRRLSGAKASEKHVRSPDESPTGAVPCLHVGSLAEPVAARDGRSSDCQHKKILGDGQARNEPANSSWDRIQICTDSGCPACVATTRNQSGIASQGLEIGKRARTCKSSRKNEMRESSCSGTCTSCNNSSPSVAALYRGCACL